LRDVGEHLPAQRLRVGLFTSPHLVSFAERIQVNRQWIPESDFARLAEEMQRWLAEFPKKGTRHYSRCHRDGIALVLRTAVRACRLGDGLGGRLDATNIITPRPASLPTSLDHQQWLGDTLDKIAAEKAHSYKPGVPVITGRRPAAAEVIGTKRPTRRCTPHHSRAGFVPSNVAATVRSRGLILKREQIGDALPACPLPRDLSVAATLVSAGRMLDGPAKPGSGACRELPLSGSPQEAHAAVAIATGGHWRIKFPSKISLLGPGLAGAIGPARMQIVEFPDGRVLVLDGAHNPDGAAALARRLRGAIPGRHGPTLVLGVLADKDWPPSSRTLAPLAGRIVLRLSAANARSTQKPPVRMRRRTLPRTLRSRCVYDTGRSAGNTGRDSLVLITGSLYWWAKLGTLGLAPTPSGDERALNEWSPLRG